MASLWFIFKRSIYDLLEPLLNASQLSRSPVGRRWGLAPCTSEPLGRRQRRRWATACNLVMTCSVKALKGFKGFKGFKGLCLIEGVQLRTPWLPPAAARESHSVDWPRNVTGCSARPLYMPQLCPKEKQGCGPFKSTRQEQIRPVARFKRCVQTSRTLGRTQRADFPHVLSTQDLSTQHARQKVQTDELLEAQPCH